MTLGRCPFSIFCSRGTPPSPSLFVNPKHSRLTLSRVRSIHHLLIINPKFGPLTLGKIKMLTTYSFVNPKYSPLTFRILIYLVKYDSGQVNLEHFLLSWYPFQSITLRKSEMFTTYASIFRNIQHLLFVNPKCSPLTLRKSEIFNPPSFVNLKYSTLNRECSRIKVKYLNSPHQAGSY